VLSELDFTLNLKTLNSDAYLGKSENQEGEDETWSVRSTQEILNHFDRAAKVVYCLTSSTNGGSTIYAKSVIRQSLTSNA